MTNPRPPAGPSTPTPPPGPKLAAAEYLIRVTDHARELGKVGRLTEVDRDLVALAEHAWDAVRGVS